MIDVIISVVPFIAIAFATLAAITLAGVTLANSRFLVYPYLLILFFVPMGSFGSLEASGISLYSRGVGVLYFPLLVWFIFAALLWSKLGASLAGCRSPQSNLTPWFIAWIFLLAAHTVVGVFLGVTVNEILAPTGFSNIVGMGILIMLILVSFQDQLHLEELTRFVLLAGLIRAVFGLVRWAAFGGDPANVYANYGGMNLKLTYFDINDNLLCILAFSIATVRLFAPSKEPLPTFWRSLYWMTLLVTITCVILSYRRTAWVGLLLAGVVILWQLPLRRRVQALIVAAPAVLATVAYAAFTRLSQTKGAGGIDSFFYDIAPKKFGEENARLLELQLAWADFMDHPIAGIGAWGRYTGHQSISWQSGETYPGAFVHSGVVHIAFKSGLIGLSLLAGILIAFIVFVRRALSEMSEPALALGVAGVAGAAFMLPDFVIGTPIPQLRTTQMIGLCLGLPYLAAGIGFSDSKSIALLSAGRAAMR